MPKSNLFKSAGMTLAACVVLSLPGSAGAWGAEGHQYIGNLAWKLLNPNAQAHVAALLDSKVSLGQAAVWPDCVRSVTGSPGNGFSYHSDKYTSPACNVFGNDPAEVQRMTDYASRNWTNCEYAGHNSQCNLSYHFADVNTFKHGDYDASYFGAQPYDVVHAIEAAEAVLKCPDGQTCAVPAPFNIVDKREALLMLAHFVGDVHQPLHVGAVYLDAQNAPTGDDGTTTVGGNYLLLPSGYKENLHHSWDRIPSSLKAAPTSAAVKSACKLAAAYDPNSDTPEKWAGESVLAAKAAYSGMSFARDPKQTKDWDVHFDNPKSYASARAAAQKQRLISAGARLAAVLNSIWPSSKPATACRGAVH